MRVAVLAAALLPAVGAVANCTTNGSICKPGVMLPVWEPQLGIGTGDVVCRAIVYLLGLFYLFLGTSIIADRFMTAIEVITSKEKEVKVKRVTGEEYTILVRVWNETVSNLSLMALGSSAPEILLSVIEIIGNKFEAGALGPGTIVGSAAFNLFVIIAICVGVVPSNEVRRIKHIGVFWVTAVWSIFAYVWLYLILAQISPGEVTLWEGLVTFSFFPLTVVSSYIADRKLFGIFEHRYMNIGGGGHPPSRPVSAKRYFPLALRRATETDAEELGGTAVTNGDVELSVNPRMGQPMTEEEQLFENHREQYINTFKELRGRHPDAPIELLETMAEEELVRKGPKSRAFYRINATRQLIGAGNVVNKRIHEIEAEKRRIKAKAASDSSAAAEEEKTATVVFTPGHYTCMEDIGTLYATVTCRRNKLEAPCIVMVDFKTEDGTASAVDDYTPVQGTLTFYPNEEKKHIGVEIVDNDIYEEDEHFSIVLSNIRATVVGADGKSTGVAAAAKILTPSVATVLIVDNDHCGAFGFEHESRDISEAAEEIQIKVVRSRGARGQVVVPYRTVDGSAKAGHDYIHREGELIFDDEQAEAIITIEIINDDTYEKSEDFSILLDTPIWEGAEKGDDIAELGKPILSDTSRCKVTIKESKEFKGFVDKMLAKTSANVVVGSSSWKQQFAEALSVSGGDEDNDQASCFDFVMHGITLPWKLLFALIPPTEYAGDTFASKTAALGDSHADSSIINVTGSNAVNVFLGIGLAWAIAAIYHTANGTRFMVDAGSLAFSVTLFCVGAVISVLFLQVRRYSNPPRAELGGDLKFKIVTMIIFLGLWFLYVTFSTLEAYCVIEGF